jgi:signal transduction histidine kinase
VVKTQILPTDRYKVTGSEKLTPIDSWLIQRELAVAWLRLAFAVLAIAVIQLNPSRIVRFPFLSEFSLGSFLLYSVVTVYCARRKMLGASVLGLVTTALDVLFIALIVVSTGGTRTPFFIYYSFPAITAGIRWGIKGSLPVALVCVGIYAIIRLSLAAEAMAEPMGMDTLVVRSLYLIVLASMFGYISEFEKRQNHKLLALSHTAGQVARLEERRRIMYEIHDGILQTLATLILRVEECQAKLPSSQSNVIEELHKMEDLARSSMKDIRQFLAGKEIQPLVHGTLVEKLRDEMRFLQDGLGVRAIIETEPEEFELPQEIEREIYFVLREGLTTVTRHAHAARAEIHLRMKGQELEGLLKDDGVGIRALNTSTLQGVGLSSMRERIEKLGGELVVKSAPGSGTKISFVVPLSV